MPIKAMLAITMIAAALLFAMTKHSFARGEWPDGPYKPRLQSAGGAAGLSRPGGRIGVGLPPAPVWDNL